MMATIRCKHSNVKPGPRVAAVYGSWETEVCRRCGKYRVNHHYWGPWKRGPVPTEKAQEAVNADD